MKKYSIAMGWLIMLTMVPSAIAQLEFGDNWRVNSSALINVGYQADYGNQIQSDHGLNFGADGQFNGYFYNPNFLNFTVLPYYNQDRLDSSSQSLTNSSGVAGSANLFTGSHFPGSVSYNYSHNSTGTFGLEGTPNFTSVGNGQGFGVKWGVLFDGWPTLSVGYQQGSGSGTIYGTDEQTSSHNRVFNVNSNYAWSGFHLNGFYNHDSLNYLLPGFLEGETESSTSDSNSSNFGFGVSHQLPVKGQFYLNYNRSDVTTNFFAPQGLPDTNSNYVTDSEAAGVTFHPTYKLTLYGNENYSSNLAGSLSQEQVNSGTVAPLVELGSGSHSYTVGGGVGYAIYNNLIGEAQATYYDQHYFGRDYTGTYISGTVNYNKRLWNMFSFSASVVDSTNAQGTNNVGFIGNVNFSHNFGRWETGGLFSYAQNVQSELITYTTSYYNYSANVRRRLARATYWSASFNGSHSGVNQDQGTEYHSEGFSTSLSVRGLSVNGNYSRSRGNSLITPGGLVPLPPTPGLPPNYVIHFNGDSYGGGVTWSPIQRLSVTGTYTRAISDTLNNSIFSNNNTQIYFAQLQYHFRRISAQAGYSRFTQGISATGVLPGTTTSYYFGISRYFNFF